MSNAQHKGLKARGSRTRGGAVVRVAVQVAAVDAQIVRDVASILRDMPEMAETMRAQLRSVVAAPRTTSVFDVFGSDLPDAYFDGVFETGRHNDPPRDAGL